MITIDRAIEILDPEHRENYDGMDDETVPIWAKVLAIEKIASFETLHSITKDELKHAIQWLFEHYDFDIGG